MSQAILKKTRHYSAAILVVAAVFLLSLLFVSPSRSANPASNTLNPAGPNVQWTGTALGGTSPEGETTCVEGINCDTFLLTLSGTPGDWVGKKAHINISWPGAGDDYDVYVHKCPAGTPTVAACNAGPLATSSADGGAGPEVAELNPNNPNVGTGTFSVRVVYWLVPLPGQYTGTASAVGAAVPTPTPSPGATPTPTATPPGTPRFVNHYAPPGWLEDAGEPTMGVNWNTENVSRPAPGAQTFKNRFRNGVEQTIGNGGTSLYYGGVNSYFLRANFDDCSSPAMVDWAQIPLLTANATRAFYDPILYTDHWTGRTWVCQELGLTPGGSTIEFTDNDGDQMYQSQGAAPSGGIDHQTIGGGPLHVDPLTGLKPPTLITPKIPTSPPGSTPIPDPGATPYPHAVYYASQNIASATAQLSLDGGFAFPTNNPMFTAADCAGLHGHAKVAEDGTVFVPDKACAQFGVPLVMGGHPAVAVSEDNGLTWQVRIVPTADSDGGVDDPSVGVSWCPPGTCSEAEKANRSNHIYLGFMYAGGRPGVAYSPNKGQTWSSVTDLSTLAPGIKHIAFPMVAVGDPDRAAFAFLGTTTQGNYSAPEFEGVWHLYIATTFNGTAANPTWTIQNLSPEGPVQRFGVCGDGTCRNLLDFQDIQIDKQGRILIAGQDGCVGSCELGPPNSFTAKAYISRQEGGTRMFSIYDIPAAEPHVPSAPNVTGVVDGSDTKVTLDWPAPDHGGAPITGYNIYRSIDPNQNWALLTPLATVIAPPFVDNAAPPGAKYYIVTAVNSSGEGPYCKVIAPGGGPVANACDLPGILLNDDTTSTGADNDAPANVPIDSRVNFRQLFVAEPFVPGQEQFVFTMRVAPSDQGAAPPFSQWFIIWNRQGTDASDPNDANFDRIYLAMATDAAGTPRFDYGKFGVLLDPTNPNPRGNTPVKFGNADSGSYDPLTGEIRITISKSKLRAIDGGATKYQATTTSLAGTNVRTYFVRPDYVPDTNPFLTAQRSQNNASDISGEASYILRGNAICAPQAQLVRAVSRRTHDLAGDFDIRLFPPPTPGVTPLEPRVSDGGVYHIVFTFASPVTFGNATASNATVQNTSTSGNDVIVNVAPASEATPVTVTLVATTAGGAASDITVPFEVLVGDSNLSERRVNVGDTNFCKERSGQLTNGDNFVADLNCDARINVGDVNVAKSHSGNSLTSPPSQPSGRAAQRTR